MTYHKDRFSRIAQAIIESKPKLIDGKAIYVGQTYESLDDAWDWFENDLQAIKDILEGDFDTIIQLMEEKETAQ
jgi:hypothetical protein